MFFITLHVTNNNTPTGNSITLYYRFVTAVSKKWWKEKGFKQDNILLRLARRVQQARRDQKMRQTELWFLVSITMLGTAMSRSHSKHGFHNRHTNFHNSSVASHVDDGNKKSYMHTIKRSCPLMSFISKLKCFHRASKASNLNDNDMDDLDFFKNCIVNFYCFKQNPVARVWTGLPSFRGLIGTTYFNNVAKRVELFFIRNNDWSRTVVNPKFRNPATRECTNLLYITAARYLYVIYVLNLLRGDMTFAPCKVKLGTTKLIVPSDGVCFPIPHGVVTCTSDFDISLLGRRSGSLVALFNQFFQETLGRDPIVAGFGKSAEEIFDTNVQAFTLEYAMPMNFEGLSSIFRVQMSTMNEDVKFKVQEVVSAILKMDWYNSKFFNDLMSDQVELRSAETKHKLNVVFHDWTVQFQGFKDAVNSLLNSDQYTSIISFKHKVNIAYEMILGLVESAGLPKVAGNALAQNAIAHMYASEAYHTRGSIRHVVGPTLMQKGKLLNKMSNNDYWVSMLENWADAVKEYNRECKVHGLRVVACLPKMSKYLWRTLDAMYAVRKRLSKDLANDLMRVDTVRQIVAKWLENVKRKGFNAIPDPSNGSGESDLAKFLKAFNCPSLTKHEPLVKGCMDAIQAEIRKYNRRLFLDLVKSDS